MYTRLLVISNSDSSVTVRSQLPEKEYEGFPSFLRSGFVCVAYKFAGYRLCSFLYRFLVNRGAACNKPYLGNLMQLVVDAFFTRLHLPLSKPRPPDIAAGYGDDSSRNA